MQCMGTALSPMRPHSQCVMFRLWACVWMSKSDGVESPTAGGTTSGGWKLTLLSPGRQHIATCSSSWKTATLHWCWSTGIGAGCCCTGIGLALIQPCFSSRGSVKCHLSQSADLWTASTQGWAWVTAQLCAMLVYVSIVGKVTFFFFMYSFMQVSKFLHIHSGTEEHRQ